MLISGTISQIEEAVEKNKRRQRLVALSYIDLFYNSYMYLLII